MNAKNDQPFTFPNNSQHVQGCVRQKACETSPSQVNYASLSGKMGAPNAQISKAYSSPVTPAGFAFSPWSCKSVHLNEGACELQHFLLCNGIRLPFSFCISCFQPNHMLVFWPRICAKQWWIMVVCCPYIFRPSLGASLLSISLVLGQFLCLADHRRHSKT